MKKLITCLLLIASAQLYSNNKIYEDASSDDDEDMITYRPSTLVNTQPRQNNNELDQLRSKKVEPNYCALGCALLGTLTQLQATQSTIQDPRYKLPLTLLGSCLTIRGFQASCLDPDKCCVCIPPTKTGKAACCFASVCVPLATYYGLPPLVAQTCPSVTKTISMPMLTFAINEGTALITGCITPDKCYPCSTKK